MKAAVFAVVLAFFFGAGVMNVVSQPVSESGMKDAKALFENKCSTCHGFNKSTSKKKTPEEWAKTVSRMKAKAAKKDVSIHISDEEEKTITDYLTKEYAK